VRTVAFEKIIERCARKCGVIPGSADYTDEFVELLVDGINEGLPYAWKAAQWPDVVLIEERQFAADFDGAETYAEDDIVLYEDEYWISLAGSNTGNTPADGSAWWETTSDYDLYIAREQDWEDEEIAEFLTITDRDPRKSRVPFYYLFKVDEAGAWLTSNCSSATVWVKSRKPCPKFGWEHWETATTYAAGDLVIGTDGECYVCVAASTGNDPVTDTTNTYWSRVEFPESFERYVLHYARAYMLEDDGQDDKSGKEKDEAEWALQCLSLELFGGQDQQETPVRMAGYGVEAGRR
jgi:hypothetical protein